jgi:hypothetical protein
MMWRPLIQSPARSSGIFLCCVLLLVGALVSTHLLDTIYLHTNPEFPKTTSYPNEILLDCTDYNLTRTCPSNYPTTFHREEDPDLPSPSTCPEYFRWIYEDLRLWAYTGITREMVESLKPTANFRLVIVKGKAFVERYTKAYQTRDVFTLWGILQLLRRYPGQVPDLDLMFDCIDIPSIKTSDYQQPNASDPPPLFRYCGDDDTLNIVFPDWSFWGWPETNIKPWESLMTDLKEGNKRMRWTDREPYAYWKGNPTVAVTREDLLKCNVSENMDWKARLYAQDWIRESEKGYKQSDLASQCDHRYKIYIEGTSWSVSEKYILACDSVSLIVKPHYYDFFTRSLIPLHHYWPVRDDDKCRSIKFAVDWGNAHKKEAQEIGKAASQFTQEELKMEYVYDYMFHLLNQYAKLLTFQPVIPANAVELCSETMACLAQGLEKKFLLESMVKGPVYTSPCAMPPPYDPPSLHTILKTKEDSIKKVELWEKKFWENQNEQA